MSLFTDPIVHDANPPHTWEVTRTADRVWNVHPAGHPATVIVSCSTRAAAVEATRTGFYVELWERESRWYRGDTPAGWRPYRPATVELAEPVWCSIPMRFPNGTPDRYDPHDTEMWFAGHAVDVHLVDGGVVSIVARTVDTNAALTGSLFDETTGAELPVSVAVRVDAVASIEVP